MNRTVAVIIIAASFALFGCSGKKAEETFETAQFEELQNNYDHARELYRKIIEQYPDSEYAEKASERLNALADRNR